MFVSMRRRHPTSSLFPYTTLFRSVRAGFGEMGSVRRNQDSVRRGPGRPRADPGSRRSGPELARLCTDILQRAGDLRSEEHTSELQSHLNLVCRLLLEKKKKKHNVI